MAITLGEQRGDAASAGYGRTGHVQPPRRPTGTDDGQERGVGTRSTTRPRSGASHPPGGWRRVLRDDARRGGENMIPSGKCWLYGRANRHRYVRRLGMHRYGQICCSLLHTAKSVVKSELSKSSPQTRGYGFDLAPFRRTS